MYLYLPEDKKAYFSSVLDDTPDMGFSALFAGEEVTIIVRDMGSLLYSGPIEYNFGKRIDVFDKKNDLMFCIDYRNFHSTWNNADGFQVYLSGTCTSEKLEELLELIKANKEALAQKNAPIIKKVVARVMSTFSKVKEVSRK